MAGLLNAAGISLQGGFAGAQLRVPTPAARVSAAPAFNVVAVRETRQLAAGRAKNEIFFFSRDCPRVVSRLCRVWEEDAPGMKSEAGSRGSAGCS